jgi:hypothetical protein
LTLQRAFDLFAYAAAILAAPFFCFIAISQKHRSATQWIRSVCLLVAITGIAFGVLGLVLLLWPSYLDRGTRILLSHIEFRLAPFVLGLLVSLFLSSEFRQILRSGTWKAWFDSVF